MELRILRRPKEFNSNELEDEPCVPYTLVTVVAKVRIEFPGTRTPTHDEMAHVTP